MLKISQCPSRPHALAGRVLRAAAGSSAEHGGKLGGHNGIIGVTARQHMALAASPFQERARDKPQSRPVYRALPLVRGGLYAGSECLINRMCPIASAWHSGAEHVAAFACKSRLKGSPSVELALRASFFSAARGTAISGENMRRCPCPGSRRRRKSCPMACPVVLVSRTKFPRMVGGVISRWWLGFPPHSPLSTREEAGVLGGGIPPLPGQNHNTKGQHVRYIKEM